MSLFSTTISNIPPNDDFDPFDLSNRFQDHHNSLETATQFLNQLQHITNSIALQMKPDGSQMYPARTCRDIADHYPTKPDGRTMSFQFR